MKNLGTVALNLPLFNGPNNDIYSRMNRVIEFNHIVVSLCVLTGRHYSMLLRLLIAQHAAHPCYYRCYRCVHAEQQRFKPRAACVSLSVILGNRDCDDSIGVGDGGSGRAVAPPAPKFGQKLFSGKNRVKFEHFVNFSCIYFRAKMSCSPKVDWAPTPMDDSNMYQS